MRLGGHQRDLVGELARHRGDSLAALAREEEILHAAGGFAVAHALVSFEVEVLLLRAHAAINERLILDAQQRLLDVVAEDHAAGSPGGFVHSLH